MILEAVPNQLLAGDTWRWTRAFSLYPAPTWVVTYYFENQAKQFSSAATADGTSHAVNIASTLTTGYPAGRYRWYARAVSGAIVETIADENGWLEVLPDIGVSGTHDHRSWARRTLDALEATLEGKASADQLAMTINGRSLSRIPLPELVQWQAQLRAEVRTEETGSAAGAGRYYKVRLSRG